MMNESATPRRRKASRRTEILAAARAVFSERSFEQASVGEIASRAGCVEGTLYTYFRSKRELLDSVLADFYDELIADITPRFASISGTDDRLSFLVARHLQIAVDEPGLGRLIRESRIDPSYFGSKLHALNRRYSQFVAQTLREGVARGELREGLDVALARDLLFGGLEHVSGNALGRGRRLDPPRQGREIALQLLQGWAAPASPLAGDVPAEASVMRLERRLARVEQELKLRGDD